MAKGKTKCKYCGCVGDRRVCGSCGAKLKLVRQLLNMVKDYKKKVKGDV